MSGPWAFSAMAVWRVTFECGHVALILDEEHGDGSAWCQLCGAFKCYENVTGCPETYADTSVD